MLMRGGGFTLVELVATMALAAVVLGTSAVSLPPLLASVRLGAAAQRLAATLRQARGRALERNVRIEVRLDPAQRRWRVREWGGIDVESHQLPAGVTFAGLPASGQVRFGTTGTSDNATITLAAGSGVRRVIVNQRGRVRVL
ncbi:MAG: GspH/FimT family pseudopilin [bacterium]|nr:GspH/FimT family pseudopilin [bacterium]